MSRTVNSLLNYIGSKARVVGRLCTHFPIDLPKYEYREPMIGGGSVLLGLAKNGLKPQVVRIGDMNPVVYEIWYRALYSTKELIEDVDNALKSISSLSGMDSRLNYLDKYVDPIIKEIILNRVRQYGNYGEIIEHRMNKACEVGIDLEERVLNLHTLLKGSTVQVLNKHYEWALTQESLDGRPVLVFLDPPYYKVYDKNGYYGEFHKNFDYSELLHLLRITEHKFIMTIDNSPEMGALFKEFNCKLLPVPYSMSKKTVDELLVTNF